MDLLPVAIGNRCSSDAAVAAATRTKQLAKPIGLQSVPEDLGESSRESIEMCKLQPRMFDKKRTGYLTKGFEQFVPDQCLRIARLKLLDLPLKCDNFHARRGKDRLGFRNLVRVPRHEADSSS